MKSLQIANILDLTHMAIKQLIEAGNRLNQIDKYDDTWYYADGQSLLPITDWVLYFLVPSQRQN